MDYQALGVGVAAVLTAFGAVLTGLYTGHNSRAKDQDDARLQLEGARAKNELAIEEATKMRIEAIVKDASEARKETASARQRANDIEDEMSTMRRNGQRGWDLASYHFGLVAFLSHMLNNIFTMIDLNGTDEAVVTVVKNAKKRMETVKIPVSLESPLDDPHSIGRQPEK